MTRAKDISRLITDADFAGTLTVGDLTASSLNSGQFGGRRNIVINGGFTVSQRIGTTLTASTNNNYTLDRWNYYLGGSCRNSTQQLVSDNTKVTALNTASGQTFNNALLADCTTAASIGTDDLLGYIQIIEGSNSVPLAGQTCTLSFYVQSSVAGRYYVALKIGSARSYIASYDIDSADTWERKTITLTMDTLAQLESGGSLTNGGGFQMHFTLRSSISGQVTNSINQWVDGNFYAKSGMAAWGTSTDHNWYLAGVQLEVGSVATPFEHRSFGEELALCQRYFQKSFRYDQAPENAGNTTSINYNGHVAGYCGSNNSGVLASGVQLSPEMRATPTITTYGNSNGHWGYLVPTNSGSITYSSGAGYITQIHPNGFNVGQNVSNNTLLIGFGQWTATAEL